MSGRGNAGQYGATEITTPKLECEYFDKLPKVIQRFMQNTECNFSSVNIYDVWCQHGTEAALRSMIYYNKMVRREAYGRNI